MNIHYFGMGLFVVIWIEIGHGSIEHFYLMVFSFIKWFPEPEEKIKTNLRVQEQV